MGFLELAWPEWRNLHPLPYFAMNSQNKSWHSIPGDLHVPGYDSNQKDMKTKGANNHWAQLDCHKLMTLATYKGRSLSSGICLQELEKELDN